jgi:hypothetical protein
MSLLTRPKRPKITDVRSVFIHTHTGRKGTESIPPILDFPDWREWTKCSPADIEKGLIVGLAAHREFRQAGGPGLFRFTPTVDCIVHLFDPAVHRQKNGRILDCHYTVYSFKPH